jgi:hypothetical protein
MFVVPLVAALLSSTSPAALNQREAIFPFPSPLLTVAAAAGGGGGGGDTRFTHIGTTTTSNGNSTTGYAAGLCAMTFVTPASNCNAYAVCLRQMSTTPAGTKMKAVIYSDNAGQPGNLLATGTEYTTHTVVASMDVSLPFATPFALVSGTKYWYGAIASSTFNGEGPGGGTNTQYWYTTTYATGPLATAPAMSHNGATPCAYLSVGDSTAAGGTGFIGSSSNWVSTTPTVRATYPVDRAPGDIAFVHIAFTNTSGAPSWSAPEGFTLISEQQLGGAVNYRELVYWRRIDGTECIPGQGIAAGLGSLDFTVSLWRGYTGSGTPYEALATAASGTNTNPVGNAITTLGANRTAINFYSKSDTNVVNGGGASGWSDKYDANGSGGTGTKTLCSAKDVAVAGAVAAEARTSTTDRWRCFTLALIKT